MVHDDVYTCIPARVAILDYWMSGRVPASDRVCENIRRLYKRIVVSCQSVTERENVLHTSDSSVGSGSSSSSSFVMAL